MPSRYRRLHVITGDANRSQFTTWLKAGTLASFLTCLEASALPELELADPVAAFRTVSHDTSLDARLELTDGRRLSALDLQEAFAEAVAADASHRPDAYDADLNSAWSRLLWDLRTERESCDDRLDWMAKLHLLQAYAVRLGLDPDDAWGEPRLAQLDLAWARLDRPGPFDVLEKAGRVRTLVTPAQVTSAGAEPPSDTRAWLRGTLVRLVPERVLAASWDWMAVRDTDGRVHRLDLAEPTGLTAERVGAVPDAAAVDALLRRLG